MANLKFQIGDIVTGKHGPIKDFLFSDSEYEAVEIIKRVQAEKNSYDVAINGEKIGWCWEHELQLHQPTMQLRKLQEIKEQLFNIKKELLHMANEDLDEVLEKVEDSYYALSNAIYNLESQ